MIRLLSTPARLLLTLMLALSLPAVSAAQEQVFEPTRFSVEIVGEGPDVVFIPGLSTSREVWRDTVTALGPGHRIHLVQIKGFGEPAGPNAEGPVLDPLVAELARYIEANGIERPAVVGHSLGGLIALKLGAEYPDVPGKLMIVDALPWFGVTVAPPGSGATPATLEPQARQLRDMLVSSYGSEQPVGANQATLAGYLVDRSKLPLLVEWTANADPRVTGQLVYEDIMADSREDIAAITAPLTMVYPWNETYPMREQADAFYRQQYARLPGVTFVGIGPAAHFLMVDRPHDFHAALEAFLAE